MVAFSKSVIGKQGFGAMPLSSVYGSSDDAESTRTLHRAIDLGITFFDTSDSYGRGHNETLLGKALAGQRDRLVIASKFGFRFSAEQAGARVDGSPAYARQAVEASLKRLGVDHIDLHYLHRVDTNTPIEDTVGELSRLKEEGKIGAIGLSEASAEIIRRAHKVHPIAALQSEYSLWSRDVEAEILPTVRELGIVFVPFSPLGRGFLAGSLPTEAGDRRELHPRYHADAIEANARRRALIERVAERLGVTLAQVAIAWLIAKDTVPIPGTRRIANLEANWAANKLELDEATIAELDEAFPVGTTVGDRFAVQGRPQPAPASS
ncbi:aldo/keto reductase [Novosphingobium guangzhouense]|nr:aldo/keto reductase [Novosphingobium guangzhouense]